MPHNVPKHGSISMYTAHACRCDACRLAWTTYNAEHRRNPMVVKGFMRRAAQWAAEFIACRNHPHKRCQRWVYARDYRKLCSACLKARRKVRGNDLCAAQ